MSKHLKAMPVMELAAGIASDSPIPGGGTASAVAASLAASLVAMVARLTLKRKKMKDVWEEMGEIAAEADSLRENLLDLAGDDSDAFAGVMRAWKVEAGPARDQAVERATVTAAEVPLRVVSRCLRILHLARVVVERGNPTALTDGAVAAELAWAALNGAAHNVRINLGDLPEAAFRTGAEGELTLAEADGRELYEKISGLVSQRLG